MVRKYRSAGGRGRRFRPFDKVVAPIGRWPNKIVSLPGKGLNYVAKQVRRLKEKVNSEMKQASFYGTLNAGGWQYVCINTAVPGTGHNNRIGNKIRMKYIHLRALVYSSSSQSDAIEGCRLSLVLKKDSDGASVAVADVFDQSGGPYQDMFSPRQYDGMRDHWVIRDKFLLMSETANYDVPGARFIDWYIPVDVITKYIYGSSAGTYADIQNNSLWIMFGDSATANFATCLYWARIGYIDN